MAKWLKVNGGASRDRTDGLVVANVTIYHFRTCVINRLQGTPVHSRCNSLGIRV